MNDSSADLSEERVEPSGRAGSSDSLTLADKGLIGIFQSALDKINALFERVPG